MADRSRGVWTVTADLDLLRRLGRSGFDWVALDAQHGPVERRSLYDAGRALTDADVTFVVRVPAVDPAWIGAALDAGAAAVVVPSVTGAEDAALAARSSRYPPDGERSWGSFAAVWGAPAPSPKDANSTVRCAVMVETAAALAEIDDICTTPGIDMVFVGPFDLALALGTTVDALVGDRAPGNPLGRVVAAAAAAGIAVGAFAGTPDLARRLRTHGIHCLAVTTDRAVLEAGARALLAEDDDSSP